MKAHSYLLTSNDVSEITSLLSEAGKVVKYKNKDAVGIQAGAGKHGKRWRVAIKPFTTRWLYGRTCCCITTIFNGNDIPGR